MPKKKRTYEQLERALTRAENKSARTKSAYDSYSTGSAERVSGWRDTIAVLQTKLGAAAERANIAEANVDELEVLALRVELNTLKDRGNLAEGHLDVYQEAFSASSMVSLGLLDMLKRATAPVELVKNPEGPSLAGYATESKEEAH